jgi:excinuclease UvrABC ATPase subunit
MSMKSEQQSESDLGFETAQAEGLSSAGSSSDTLLFELENRCAALRAELTELEARLRKLRIAADLCPRCGGAGRVNVRGGLYGEVHQRPCQCQVG